MVKTKKTTKISKKSVLKKAQKDIKRVKTPKLDSKSDKSDSKIPSRSNLSKKIIEDCVYTVSGETGVKIVNFLGDRPNISEFIISDKLKLDMQTVRNTLYKLHTHHVATYIRKKDRQKGWYISYWTFNKPRIKELIEIMKKMQLENLRERLAKEEAAKGVFYICPKACARLDFDQATEFEFKCPECGTLLNQQENTRTIEHLKGKIEEIKCSISSC